MKPLHPFELDLEKNILIQASAGTGKTYTITTLVIRLLAQGYPVESILVVTFTEAAAAELKLRIRQRISNVVEQMSCRCNRTVLHDDCREEVVSDPLAAHLLSQDRAEQISLLLSHALICFDQASIMTIHSFCMQVLRSCAFESGAAFDMILAPDLGKYLQQVIRDFFMVEVSNLDELFLGFLDTKNISPESLFQTVLQVSSRPHIQVIPRLDDLHGGEKNDTIINFSSKWSGVCHEILAILDGQSQEITELIQNDPGINKRSYSKTRVPKWMEQIRDSFTSFNTKVPLFEMSESGHVLYKFARERIARNTKEGHSPLSHPLFDLCQELADIWQGLENNLLCLQWKCMEFCQKELAGIREKQGLCFFDDLINDLAAALAGGRGKVLKEVIRSNYRACLIDEFQDTDEGQYRIFSALFGDKGTPFFMIGDPKQAIYGFRGGDIFTYFSAAASSEEQFTLHTNYRSSRELVQAVNGIFSSVKNPFLFEEIKFFPVESAPNPPCSFAEKDQPGFRVSLIGCDGFALDKNGRIRNEEILYKIPAVLADQVRSDLANEALRFMDKDGNIRHPLPSHMAVLVRTNEQAKAVHGALSALGIPCFVAKTGSVFASCEAQELYEILLAVAHPDQAPRIRAALTTSIFGYTVGTLADLEDQDSDFLADWQETFFFFNELWQTKGFLSMIQTLIHLPNSLGREGSSISERGLTNVFHLVELISRAQEERQFSMSLLLTWLARQLDEKFRQESQDELRLESDSKAVAIVTIHRSKGMEYPIVYLPYLFLSGKKSSSGAVLFHDPEKENRLFLDLCPSQEAWEYYFREVLAEERRLLYVALTRASVLCRVFWAGTSQLTDSALGQMIHADSFGAENCISGGTNGDKKDLDKRIWEDWQNLAVKSSGSLSVERFSFQNLGRYCPEKETENIDLYRKFQGEMFPDFSMTSFSSMVSGAKDLVSSWDLGSQETENLLDSQIEKESQATFSENQEKALYSRLADFPKGSVAGNFFHGVFEDLDFTCAKDFLKEIVRARFHEFGFEEESLFDMACSSVEQILQTPLGTEWGVDFCLEDISWQDRLTELEFVFPADAMDGNTLARVLEKNPLCKNYASRIKQSGIRSLKGFVHGFIDLVFRYKGKWYLLDYKSNYLGRFYNDYNQKNMIEAMESHDYFLQYHIYLVALHRYLKLRLENYQYESDFGGVLYLFIRGMAGKQGISGNMEESKGDHVLETVQISSSDMQPFGVFHDRPSLDVLNDLETLLIP